MRSQLRGYHYFTSPGGTGEIIDVIGDHLLIKLDACETASIMPASSVVDFVFHADDSRDFHIDVMRLVA